MEYQDSNRFLPYVNLYFKIYLSGGLTLQLILLFLITTKSPASLNSLKFFLLNTCALQVVLILLAFFTQHRNLPNSTSLAILANGPCRKFGPSACFTAYHFFLGVGLCVGLGISNTVVFRHQALQRGRTRERVFMMIGLTYIPSIIAIIIPFTANWNFPKVRAATYREHPSYDLSIYEPFSGFSKVGSFQFISATVLLALGSYAIPLVSGLLTKRVVHLINANRTMSAKTKKQSKTLAYGLAFQTFLPLVCYIPLPTAYFISQVFNVEMLLTEHLMPILICMPSFLDPFISFYFVVPYRCAICDIVMFRKSSQRVVSVRNVSIPMTSVKDSK